MKNETIIDIRAQIWTIKITKEEIPGGMARVIKEMTFHGKLNPSKLGFECFGETINILAAQPKEGARVYKFKAYLKRVEPNGDAIMVNSEEITGFQEV